MIKSMTGFARSVVNQSGLTITMEIKTLNHRFLDISTRLPRGLNGLDINIKNYIKDAISRGRIEVFLNIEHSADDEPFVEVDHNLAGQYYQCLKELKESLGIEEKISLQDIVRFGDVIKLKEGLSEEDMWPIIQDALDRALDKLLEMRRQEGIALKEDIQARLETIAGNLEAISQRIPVSTEEYRSYLKERLKDVFQIDIPDERLEQEMVIHAEKSDVTEEKVRTQTHIQQMRNLLENDGPVGRKMDFLVQELYREINTLGAKTFDIPITDSVIEIKSELEKIREQIQNIE
jgi:uncharacterized protein (TIGR00255 family)